jgi:hypothetical protein
MPWYLALFLLVLVAGIGLMGFWTAVFDRDPVDRLKGGAVAFCVAAAFVITYLERAAQ